jgi:hypothetical protein
MYFADHHNLFVVGKVNKMRRMGTEKCIVALGAAMAFLVLPILSQTSTACPRRHSADYAAIHSVILKK